MKKPNILHNFTNSAFARIAKAAKTTCGVLLAEAVAFALALALASPVPALAADGDVTLFGVRRAGDTPPPQQQSQQDTSAAGFDNATSVGSSKDVVVGPHWVHPLEVFIFSEDGAVWTWWHGKEKLNMRAKVRNFGDEIIDVGGAIGQFILSASKDKITRQAPGNNREFRRQAVQPSRNIAGVVWVHERRENDKLTFHADGKFSRTNAETGTWLNLGGGFYGAYVTEGRKETSMFKLNSSFTELEHRWSDNGTEKFNRTTSLPPEIPVVSPKKANVSPAAAPVAIKHTLANTKWRFGNTDAYVIAFSADGTYTQKTGAKTSGGKWLVSNPTTIRTLSGSITFTLSPDRRTITQTANGKSYTWNYAGALKPSATTQTAQVAPTSGMSTTSTMSTMSTRRMSASNPEEKMPVEGAFVELNILLDDAYNRALAERNKRDVEALKNFIKKAALKNAQIVRFAREAIDVVNDNEAFFAIPPVPNRKRLDYENELWIMKTSRDRAIADVASTIGRKFTERYEALLKRAARAKKNQLVVNIKRKLKYIKLPRNPWNHGHWVGLNNHDIKNGVSFFWRKGDGDTDIRVEQGGIHKGAARWHKMERGEDIGIRWIDRDFILSPDGKRMQARDLHCIRIN